ncbi:MAG TPA: citramalate synthase [Acidobacteriota bacterium]|nr:citramalate synthase [Acidobacteriota bacterium]
MESQGDRILIYDCTLRDGSQGEEISLSVADKLRIAERLDDFGIAYIEGGWPGSNPKDAEFFARAKEMTWKNSRLAAFGSTRLWRNPVDRDPNLQSLLATGTPTVTVFGKSWDFHVLHALNIELEQNLQLITESVRYLKDAGREVIFDAEHFFDGYGANPTYALQVLEAAVEGGADWIVLCDTNGGSLPGYVGRVTSEIARRFSRVGIHTHNDADLAVANSLAAVEAGARMVQGCINGYGERIGNANLTSVIPNLELKMKLTAVGRGKLQELSSVAYFVAEAANLAVPNNQPYVGKSAFAHKGGVHVSAILKDARTYEHIEPEAVGNRRRVLVSDLSGKGNLLYKIREFGDIDLERLDVRALVQHIKQLEYEGYQFEGAEASLKLLAHQHLGGATQPFQIKGFRVIVDQVGGNGMISEATVKVSVGDLSEHTAAEGNGPVNALDRATKKALGRFFPELTKVHLIDYKVRVLDARQGTAAKVRVLIESTDGEESWTTVGVSTNVIEASWYAITDSLLYKLLFRPFAPSIQSV